MKSYDWIVIGGGITGAALAYELSQQKGNVLLLETAATPNNATRYSYGGLGYWGGSDAQTQQLCEEGLARHRDLSAELEADTEFREIDLLMTIAPQEDIATVKASYDKFAIAPTFLDPQTAQECEPLLNANAIAGALHLPHAHIHPQKTTEAYLQAWQRQGGTLRYETVLNFLYDQQRVTGVQTAQNSYWSDRVVICAGGFSRALLQEVGIDVPLYFTHAEIIETAPVEVQLRGMIVPATLQRLALQNQATLATVAPLWRKPDRELAPAILDPGVIQFRDRHLCIGQISRTLSNPKASLDAAGSMSQIRAGIAPILPEIAAIPGHWRHCLVAFSPDLLPYLGALPQKEGLYLFSGFTNTLVLVPSLARRFALWAIGARTSILN
ncbi:MAG: FAD-binding oxidoreductase [Jaaginema sp. PMC 1079.18]|nr:FAD-binding oxidoreductase [Jaaginema sp. PMC 1080.18]MEC4851883.1 FAD-binding oxidoreductase [Jaaginema sp. PMC 1079.18]MEC4865361.1 FAD-binding oxidoreductase [Jaaginema sp. PMC 1078.18]